MRAVTIEPGGILNIRQHADPVPHRGEVLIRVRAAGMNFGDALQRVGAYPPPPGYPVDIPGLEVAGEVVALGDDASRFSVGDRVMGIVGGGGQAELIAVHERQLLPVPEALTWEQAGGFPEGFMTAHDALVTQARLRPGERVLVNGAAGGIGVAAVQVGAVVGADVVASVRSPGARAAVVDLGARVAVDPSDAEAHGPYDVVLELVGATNIEADLRMLRTGGRIAFIGMISGTVGPVDLALLAQKRAAIVASTLRARPLEEKALVARRVETEILPAVARGLVTVPLAGTFPLDEVNAAYEAFGVSGKVGKIVLVD
jgi:NADPH:quinone reductase